MRRVCERRWAQRNAWRGDLRPWEFPRADWGEKYVKDLLATPETSAADDEWWLVVDVNLPDWYGNLQLFVYGRFDGTWRRLAVGDWKPGIADESCFQAVVPFKSAAAPDALRISSEAGIGICGVNYIACVHRDVRLVPVKVLAASGYLKDAGNILVGNWYPAVFGHPDRYHSAFHPEGPRKFVGTLDVALGPSPDLAPNADAAPLETALWQSRIDAAAAAGGGTVRMPAGRHRTGTIFLKSGVTLELEKGCVLEGSTNIADYADIHLEYAEIREPWQALVAADCQTNVALVGAGEIFGNGAGFPFDTRLGRPRGLLFHRCCGVRVEGVTLRDLASWTCYYKECDGVVHRRVRVDSHANGNADGVDIESRNVLVEDCEIDCDDDGIVLKSDNPGFLVENVEVRRCEVRSCCSLFKLGTASHGGFRNVRFHDLTGGAARRELRNPKTGRGYLSEYRAETWPGATHDPAPISAIAVEGVDGGLLADIVFRDIDVREATCPIFIRGGLRYGRKWGNKVDLGIPFGTAKTVRDVTIENFRAKAKSFTASSITGVPGLRPRNITLRNVAIEAPGAGEAARAEIGRPVPEKADAYPESNMFDHRMLPAYGFYIRHVDGVTLDNVKVKLLSADPRQEIVAEDVTFHLP